jgi:hypothetical protein
MPALVLANPQVEIAWTYEATPIKIESYSVKLSKAAYISETGIVDSLEQSPALKKLPEGKVNASLNKSTALVLVAENKSSEDVYFFAVPHEVNPHHASAGHYFECLCIGKLFKIAPGKIWYRIVRINLNSTFQKLSRFKISHQIVGVSKSDALGKYKDRLYEN